MAVGNCPFCFCCFLFSNSARNKQEKKLSPLTNDVLPQKPLPLSTEPSVMPTKATARIMDWTRRVRPPVSSGPPSKRQNTASRKTRNRGQILDKARRTPTTTLPAPSRVLRRFQLTRPLVNTALQRASNRYERQLPDCTMNTTEWARIRSTHGRTSASCLVGDPV